jgi:hypothetical protein
MFSIMAAIEAMRDFTLVVPSPAVVPEMPVIPISEFRYGRLALGTTAAILLSVGSEFSSLKSAVAVVLMLWDAAIGPSEWIEKEVPLLE